MRRLWLGLLLLAASPLDAQDITQRRAELLQQVPAGTELRVQVGGERNIGRLVRVGSDTLFLSFGAVPIASLEDVWLRQRATRKGLRIGATAGAIGGLAYGAFLALLFEAFCETDCEDYGFAEAALITGAIGALGMVGGGALGAAIGASLPEWVSLTDRRAHIPTPADVEIGPDRRIIGSVSAAPAWARYTDGDDSGFGLRATYLYHTKHIAAGPEIGSYRLGEQQRIRIGGCPDRQGICTDTVMVSENVRHAGGLLRVGTGSDRSIEPYATLGAGLYSWGADADGSIQLGGYSLGAGMHLRNRTRSLGAFAEGRFQSNFTRSGDVGRTYGFYTFAVGGSLSW